MDILKCPNCGAQTKREQINQNVTCEYCGSEIMLNNEKTNNEINSLVDNY